MNNATRPTIALLTPQIWQNWSLLSWQGMLDVARESAVNLICAPCRELRSPGKKAAANILTDLIGAERVDGVIIWSSALGAFVSAAEIEALCQHYAPVPVVTLESKVGSYRCVGLDSYNGSCEALTHLIEVHGFHRIAFLNGLASHAGFEQRYRAYQDTLTRYGIPCESCFILSGETWPSDQEQLEQWLTTVCEAGVQAIFAATDNLALRVMRLLQSRGIRVPQQIGLIGCNDYPEGQNMTPSLTSVHMPYYAWGRQALETLLRLIKTGDCPAPELLLSHLIIRESCGCLEPIASVSVPSELHPPETPVEIERSVQPQQIVTELMRMFPSPVTIEPLISPLVEAFMAALGGAGAERFLRCVQSLLHHLVREGNDLGVCGEALSVLYRRMIASVAERSRLLAAQVLWQQAYRMIAATSQRVHIRLAMQKHRQALRLREIGDHLTDAVTMEELWEVLSEELPPFGIPACYLTLYEPDVNAPEPALHGYVYPQPAPEWARLMFAYTSLGRLPLPAEGQRFRSRQLLPDDLFPQADAHGFVCEALFFRQHQIGFALFEVGPREGYVYDVLRGAISSALHSILLLRRSQQHAIQLARQNYILDTFMENVPDAIYFKDREGRLIRVNNAYLLQWGYQHAADILGKTDAELFPEQIARVKSQQEMNILRTGEALLSIEEPGVGGRWILTTKMPIRDEHGQIIGTFGISRDITAFKQTQAALEQAYVQVEQRIAERTRELQQEIGERKRAEEELGRLQQYLKSIIDSMPSMLVGVDPEGRITQWNWEAEKITGISAEQARSYYVTEFFPDLQEEMDALRYAILNRQPHEHDHIIQTRDGKSRHVHVTTYPLLVNGFDGAVLRIDDVTEQVRVEELMMQAEKIRSIGGLAAGIAHEINNPLVVILQGIQNITRRISPEIKANLAVAESLGITLQSIRTYLEERNILEYLRRMQEAALHASKVVSNMLSFSRVNESALKVVNINQLIDDTLDLASNDYELKTRYRFTGIQIVREFDPELPRVPCIPSEIEQVLLNLLRNAAQTLAEQPAAERSPCIRIATRQDADGVSIVFEDNGPGMDTEAQRKIFDPFTQLKQPEWGTGLGLAVAYFIITTKHKGALTVESTPGAGTTFTIHLPIKRSLRVELL